MTELPTGTVTFLFTDLERSTRLWEEHPVAMQAALARHDEILRDAIEANTGCVVKMTGDGAHAAFADAASAVRAARDAQVALAEHSWGDTGELRVRMGLHTGPAEARNGDYFGTAVNRAARLMSVAHGGQVVVSLTTEELLRDAMPEDCALVDLGEHSLRDLQRPERVFQLDHRALQSQFPPLRSLDVFRGNLPLQSTSFVGREHEVAALVATLESSRLVTVTGVGGVGKTRLAIQVAADVVPEYRDGAWLCELAAIGDRDAMLQVVATALGVQPRTGATPEDGIVVFLRSKDLLLVLDNCEHLLDPIAGLVERLLAACPRVQVLATSREGLAVTGEQVWPLRSLGDDQAAELFAERARSVASASIGAEDATVREICRRLDGIPLAIELAAARAVALGPAEIAARLDERFRLLTGGRRTAVERHQTLRAAVDWSYSMLDPREQLVFSRLGVFSGSFDLSAAEATVSGDGIEAWDIVDAVTGLASKSMLVNEPGAQGIRYRLLETMRAFALERLDAEAISDEWRRRHATYFAAFAEEAGRGVRGPEELAWRARIRADLDNLRGAVAWSLDSMDSADAELAVRIVAGLAVQSSFDPSLGIGEWAERARSAAAASTPARRQLVLVVAAHHAAVGGDFERARELVGEALRDGVPDDAPWPFYPAYVSAFVEANTGWNERSLEVVEHALEQVGDRSDDAGRMTLHSVAAGAASWLGDTDRARAHIAEALEFGRRAANPSGLASSLYVYGALARYEDPGAARTALEECITLAERGASPVMYGYALSAVASLRAAEGETLGALRALREALRYASDTGNEAVGQQARFDAFVVLVGMGEPELGVALLPSRRLAQVEGLGRADPRGEAWHWQRAVESARATLGADAFDRARTRGESLGDDVVAHAIGELDRLIAEAGEG